MDLAAMDFNMFLVLLAVILPSSIQGFPNSTAAVWPMSLNYTTTDFNHTLHGILQQVRFGDGPTGLQQTAMQFDGMMGSYASFTNEAPALDVGLGSFTVAANVFMDNSREGLILCWNGLKTFPNGMRIYVVQETLHVDLYSRDRGLEYGQLMKTFTFLRIAQKQWNFIGVSFDKGTNTISMLINELKRDIHLPLDFNFGVSGIETRGGIFFGGHPRLNNPRPLQGRLACSMLFRSVVNLTELEEARTECMAALHGTMSVHQPLGIWPLDNDYASSDLSGYNLHGTMRQYIHPDGPEGRKEGATTLGAPSGGSIDIKNTFNTLAFPSEVSFFGYVYFDQIQDCDINSWHENANNTVGKVVDGPQLVIRSDTVNVKLDSGHYVTDICLSYAHNNSNPTPVKPTTSSCDDRLHVKVHTWHFIGFTYKLVDGTFTIWVDRTAVVYKIGKLEHIGNGQILRLGGTKDNGPSSVSMQPVTGFMGRMAWFYVMGTAVTVQEAYTIHEDNYRRYVLDSKPFTPVTFWPLDLTKGLWDISSYTLPGKVHGFKYTQGPGFIDNTAVSFDGTPTSYLEVESRENNLDFKSTVSVFIFIKQLANVDTTIVEWAGEGNMSNGVQLGIKNGFITVNLVRRGEKSQGNFLQGFQIVHGVWTFIGFTYDATDGLLLIWKDDAHPVIKNVGRFQIETRGNVYVGGRPNITQGDFKGDVSCFSIYGAMMQKNDVMYVRRNCQQRMYIFKSPTSMYPLTKPYMAADLGGYGNNGKPENLGYTYGPDSMPDRSTLFMKNHGSKIEITNYNMQLDLSKQLTITAYIYVDEESKDNATILEWDGMAYNTVGLGLLIKNSRLTASVYPNQYSLESVIIEPNTWYIVGLTYQYYHSSLKLWAQKYGENERAYLAEKLVEPQLLSTRGNLIVGTSPSILGTTFSGRMACLIIYGRSLSLNEGLAESKMCFKTYLAKPPTVAPVNPTHEQMPTPYNELPTDHINVTYHDRRNKVIIPVAIAVSCAVLLLIAVIFITRRRRRGDRDRYRHTRLLDGTDENGGYNEYHDDWDDDQDGGGGGSGTHSLMNMGSVKRYTTVVDSV